MLLNFIGKGWSCSYIMEKQIWDLRSHLHDSRWVKLLADFQVPVASTHMARLIYSDPGKPVFHGNSDLRVNLPVSFSRVYLY
jgi:hypothetical protein